MTIDLKKIKQQIRILDPRQEFKEATFEYEIRYDPLTSRQGRVISYRFSLPEVPDLTEMIENTQKICPFCPEVIDKFAARFPKDFIPEGMIREGDATLVPNLMPYSKYGAVVVLSKRHYLRMKDFTEEIIINALRACQEYFKQVKSFDPKVKYFSIGWNYMPIAGGSIVHPHMQVEADEYPFMYHRDILQASEEYYKKNSSIFWEDLIAKEKEIGERYVGETGNVTWLAPFLPRGKIMPDIMGIFRDVDSILNISESDLLDFANGLCRVLHYLSDQNFYSLNIAIYSGITMEDSFWTNARIVARGLFPPANVSDHDHIQRFNDEFCACRLPEEICSEAKVYFN
ncbi:MAG: hypothetical protein SVR08_01650 [Spirochaetota bacterium]|nr:hypothetical protein [Spirochaetota bacterium]